MSPARTTSRRSAGILLYRRVSGAGANHGARLEVLLVHPGGPFWAKRDEGAWSIPKGEYAPDEDPLQAAQREFAEELGTAAPDGDPLELGEVRQKSGKLVSAWALEGDLDPSEIASNKFTIEWPPRSGRMGEFPEVDRAEWFTLERAREKLTPGQVALLDMLGERVA